MADPITLEIANARLTAYLDAELRIIEGAQEVEKNVAGLSKKFKYADLPEIRKGIAFYRNEITRIESNKTRGITTRLAVLRDN